MDRMSSRHNSMQWKAFPCPVARPSTRPSSKAHARDLESNRWQQTGTSHLGSGSVRIPQPRLEFGISNRLGLGQTRHISVRHLWVQDTVRSKELQLEAGRKEERRRPRNQDSNRTDHQHSDESTWVPIRTRTIAWRTQSVSSGRAEVGARAPADVLPG